MKTLDTPILDQILDPLCGLLTPEVARKLVRLRFDKKTQSDLNKLARKCNEEELTETERRQYETFVYAIDFISILQAKARTILKRSKNGR